MRVARHALETAPMTFVDLKRAIIKQQRSEPDDGVHRRSKLVRHISHESRLSLTLEREASILFRQHAVTLFDFGSGGFACLGAIAKLHRAVFQPRRHRLELSNDRLKLIILLLESACTRSQACDLAFEPRSGLNEQ